MDIEKVKEWLNSPEGEESIKRFSEKMKAEEERKQRYIKYIHYNYKNRLDEIIQKLVDKYDSNEYINREYSLGYQPRETLLWVIFTYVKECGTEFTDEEYQKYGCMFTGEMYYLGDWTFEVMHGQGSVLNVCRKENLRTDGK